MDTTFFDLIGASSVERVHSATIAWMLSDICKALTIEERTSILNTLFKTNKTDITSIKTITEFDHIDIALTTTHSTGQKELWLLENKIKAPLAKNQLDKYTQQIKNIRHVNKPRNKDDKQINDIIGCINRYNDSADTHFTVLSLIGLLPQDDYGEWRSSKYSELSNALDYICATKTKSNNRQMAIIEEYRICLSNLVTAMSEFIKYPQKYPNVFTDGNKTKAKKLSVGQSKISGYITDNALETLFQKLYYTEIVNEISNSGMVISNTCHVGETHGNADFAFEFGEFGKDNKYLWDLSFQNGAFKLAVCESGYPKFPSNSAKKEFINKWSNAFENVRRPLSNYNKLNGPHQRARFSISYNIGSKWFVMYSRSEFIKLAIDQIREARKMAQEITRYMENQSEE